MLRLHLICLTIGLAPVLSGCTKSSEPPQRAETAKSGLMPAEEPAFDPTYVADQKDVKLLVAQKVSYEPLDTFRQKAVEAKESEETAKAGKTPKIEGGDEDQEKSESAAKTASTKKKTKTGGGLFSKMKNAALGELSSVGKVLPGGGAAGGPKPGAANEAADKKKEEPKAGKAQEDEEDEEAQDEMAADETEDDEDSAAKDDESDDSDAAKDGGKDEGDKEDEESEEESE